MTDLNPDGVSTAEIPSQMVMDYLLKELELHINMETTGRDRVEQFLQFNLTALTAVIGAVILVILSNGDFLLTSATVSLGALAILAFGIFTFLRLCISREGITLVRLGLVLIRQSLMNYGILPAALIRQSPVDTGSPSGFSPRVVSFLVFFSVFCGLVFSIAIIAGIAALLYIAKRVVFEFNLEYFALYGLPALLGFFMLFGGLQFILHRYRLGSARLLSRFSQFADIGN